MHNMYLLHVNYLNYYYYSLSLGSEPVPLPVNHLVRHTILVLVHVHVCNGTCTYILIN